MAIVGGGGWTLEACADVTRFLATYDLPAACTFRRQDIIDNTHPNYVGDLSPGSNPALLERVRKSDLLLVIGSRLDEISTQRYTLIDAPVPRQILIHVHPDSDVLGSVYQTQLPIQSGMPGFAAAAAGLAGADGAQAWAEWRAAARADYEEALIPSPYDGDLDLGRCMVWLRENLPDDAIIAIDGGNFSAWPMRFLTWRQPRTQLAPQAGAMGACAPAAVAASLLRPDRLVLGFAGDGGFMMTCQEMATAVQYGATPIYMVFDNGMFGTIRMYQEREHPRRTIGSALLNPDFAALARAYGAHGKTVARTEEFMPAFERARDSAKCALIHLKMDPEVITTRASLGEIRDAALAKAKRVLERNSG
ncbi:MAG: thiamine pyrophosphate-dependent enzyme [Alphaproteobacteria bacterium]|jgi:acetolactate synthase-1/2/3 large subunit|nr:thiamine pyrophosphate-dependent enzyme [Alphaproteobacteria bacterium]